MKSDQQRGFTLIELLVVIAIIAVLAVVVILALNPAELLKQARDSNRISDMATLNSAVSLYLADGQSFTGWSSTTCRSDSSAGISTGCGGRFSVAATTATSSSRAVDGTGWIPLNFTLISSGSPIGQLPTDPVRDGTFYYAFAASTTTSVFEANANMESTRYANGGSSNVESTDGGSDPNIYEVGTKLSGL
jgi:prepilin-type N-terminal cleavage/methylation domain-containing protein